MAGQRDFSVAGVIRALVVVSVAVTVTIAMVGPAVHFGVSPVGLAKAQTTVADFEEGDMSDAESASGCSAVSDSTIEGSFLASCTDTQNPPKINFSQASGDSAYDSVSWWVWVDNFENQGGNDRIGWNIRDGSDTFVGSIEFDNDGGHLEANFNNMISFSEETWYRIHVHNIDYGANQYDADVYDINGNLLGGVDNVDFSNAVSTIQELQPTNSLDTSEGADLKTDFFVVDGTAELTWTVSGFVKDGSGNVVEGADIEVNSTADTATTGSDGSYSLQLTNGDYELTASKDGFENGSTNISVSGSDLTDQNITLTKISSPSSSPKVGYEQKFELVSHSDLFNPQTSTLEIYTYQFDDGTDLDDEDGPTPAIQTDRSLSKTAEFDFNNIATVRLVSGTVYQIQVVGGNGDLWGFEPWIADSSKTDLILDEDDDGVVEIVICGPGGCPLQTTPTPTVTPTTTTGTESPSFGFGGFGGGGLPGYPDSWDPDGDGVIDNLPDLEQPEFELPGSNLSEPGPYLQTGLFNIGGQRCAGVRYWDPTYETTEFDYDFEIDGTQFEGTETFDEPIGYYESCVDESNVGDGGSILPVDNTVPDPEDVLDDGAFNFSGTIGEDTFSGAFDFGAGAGSIGGSIGGGGPLAPGGGGSDPSSGFPGLLFLIGTIAGSFASRRYVPRDPLPGAAARIPVTQDQAVAAAGGSVGAGLFLTGSVPAAGPAIGLIGIVLFIWTEVLHSDPSNIPGL